MTERENYLRVVRDHEIPEWLPRIQHCTMGCGPSYLNARRTPDGKIIECEQGRKNGKDYGYLVENLAKECIKYLEQI